MDVRLAHRAHVEELALRRLPLAMAIVAAFIGAALPLEVYLYPNRLRPYLAVYATELMLCGVALLAARRWRRYTRLIAVTWGALLAVCVAAYYPLVRADANVAMAALICLVAMIPTVLPFDVRHALIFGSACVLAFFGVARELPTALPWQYSFVAFLAVLTTSTIGVRSIARFRWEAFEREAILRQAHDQLRTALVRAEDAVAMRSRLVANVSHELRTPLNVIVGYADMLVDASDDRAAVADAAPRIRDYAISLEALVSDLLDLSRLTCGKVSLSVEDVELVPLLEDVARGARAIARGDAVTVTVSCDVPRVRTDAMRLRQILNNLATNAAKFTDTGTIVIAARRDGGAVVLEVRDTGCGIPPAEHEAIFAAFEQLGPRSARRQGIGLGLAIVRQLTDVLGGTVRVVSAVGQGSTFSVRLPIAPDEGATTEQRAAAGTDDAGASGASPLPPTLGATSV